MPTEVVIKNASLDRSYTGKILLSPPITDEEQDKFYLYHGIEQIKTHAGLSADIQVNDYNRDSWGEAGKVIGSTLKRLIDRRRKPTFKSGCSVIAFGENVSITALRESRRPTTNVYFDTKGLYNERDVELADKVRVYVQDFFYELANALNRDILIVSAPFSRFRTRGSVPYGGSLADLHHRVENAFKALANSIRQDKAVLSEGLGGNPLEPRRTYITSVHGEAKMNCETNLDGSGEAIVELSSVLDSNYLNRFKENQRILAKRGMLDIALECYSIGRHHTIEDLGIPQGQAFLQAIKSNPHRLVRFGYDFYVDPNKFVLAATGISNRYSFVGNLTPEFMRRNDTTLHYLEQMLQDARWETYIHVGTPDFQQLPFDDNTAYDILYKIFRPNSEYGRPANTIRPYEGISIEEPDLALFYVLGGAIRMGTRIDRSQPEGVASSKGVLY